jgi:hypothetical protein
MSKYVMAQSRLQEVRTFLDRIHQAQGTIYTLGLLMGIVARLSQHDYSLYKELEARADNLERKGKQP